MTHITITQISGGGPESYDAIVAALPTSKPNGLLARYAGADGGTFVITAVWASKTQADQFATGPLCQAVRTAARPPTETAQTFEYAAMDEYVAQPATSP